MTVHSALKFPVTHDFYSPDRCLSAKTKEQLRSRYENVRLVVIDEVSMLSGQQLVILHERLTELFADNNPDSIFGGKIVIFCGDLFQV